MRIAVLWSELSGYFNACLQTLLYRHGSRLYVSSRPSNEDAPFDPAIFSWLEAQEWRAWPDDNLDKKILLSDIVEFAPDAILVSSWQQPAYRYVLRRFRRTTRILCMDHPWVGTAKQWAVRINAPWYIRPLYDAAFVPGERQYQFARRLGFRDADILPGLLTCDREQFSKARVALGYRSFIYVGRLSPEKGVQVLLDAYRIYREGSNEPWPLLVIGSGPMQEQVAAAEGVQSLGFIQPNELPNVLAPHGCLVMPGLFEPWGVAIHEATSCGIPVICSNACGASVHLVRNLYNGLVVPGNDAPALARAMQWIMSRDDNKHQQLRENSRCISSGYSPELWADTLLDYLDRRQA